MQREAQMVRKAGGPGGAEGSHQVNPMGATKETGKSTQIGQTASKIGLFAMAKLSQPQGSGGVKLAGRTTDNTSSHEYRGVNIPVAPPATGVLGMPPNVDELDR